jgi:mannose-6-phosphate isomerase-like protein (cupin superfamily)
MDAEILKAGEGRRLRLSAGVAMVVKEDGTHTRGTLGLAESELAPRAEHPLPHIHHAHEEGFYVLAGEVEFVVGTDTVQAGPGTFLMVPIGVPHCFRNPTEQPARFLCAFTPRRYLYYFEEVSQLLHTTTSPTRQQRADLMARYDTEVVS